MFLVGFTEFIGLMEKSARAWAEYLEEADEQDEYEWLQHDKSEVLA